MLDKRMRMQIIHTCRSTVSPYRIAASCIIGDFASKPADSTTILEVLLVVYGFQARLMSYLKTVENTSLIVLAVDKWIFERDVDRGLLGEAIGGRLAFPYICLENPSYLYTQELRLKERLIKENLESLVLNYPELSHSFHIAPEYFMYETMTSRARLFPPMIHSILNIMESSVKERNIRLVMKGYLKALEELESKGFLVVTEKGYIRIAGVTGKRGRKTLRFVNAFSTARKILLTSALGTVSGTLALLSRNRPQFDFDGWENSGLVCRVGDPHDYVHIPTAQGLVPLSDRTDIKSFAAKLLSSESEAKIDVERIGGILNDVYLVKLPPGAEDNSIVAKSFRDWTSLKWFPVSLWALGTKTFAVLGSSRLDRECAINQLLSTKGFDVPRILHISHGKRLVFMNYVTGEKVSGVVKDILKSPMTSRKCVELDVISKFGKELAKVHSEGITLGDTKPENAVFLRENGEIVLMDFEQASRNGDRAWDIAEFIYYSGRYASPLAGTRSMECMTKAFIQGYECAGGEIRYVRKAGTAKYTKVFSVVTLPHIIFTVSNVCRNA